MMPCFPFRFLKYDVFKPSFTRTSAYHSFPWHGMPLWALYSLNAEFSSVYLRPLETLGRHCWLVALPLPTE